MFTIQYANANGSRTMEKFESDSWQLLVNRLAQSDRPIMAVYERDVPITKTLRAQLAQVPEDKLSDAARVFAMFA